MQARLRMLPTRQAQAAARNFTHVRLPALLACRSLVHSATGTDGIEMLASTPAGRGYFATRRLRVGERILHEAPIVSDDLARLAEVIWNTPKLRDGLHMPSRFPAQENPPQGCSHEDWSKACAQAMSNGCVNVSACGCD